MILVSQLAGEFLRLFPISLYKLLGPMSIKSSKNPTQECQATLAMASNLIAMASYLLV